MIAEVEVGRVVDVTERVHGSELTVAASQNDTTITVADVLDFPERGGRLTIGGYSVGYTAVDDLDGDGEGTITLAAGLPLPDSGSTYGVGWRVEVEPRTVTTEAQVFVGDGDPISARLSASMMLRLGEAVRDQLEGETVTVVYDDERDEWTVADADGLPPTIDADLELRANLFVRNPDGDVVGFIDGQTAAVSTGPEGGSRAVLSDWLQGGELLFYRAGVSGPAVRIYSLPGDRGTFTDRLILGAQTTQVEALIVDEDLYIDRNAKIVSRDGPTGPRVPLTADTASFVIDTGASTGVLRLYGDRIASRNANDSARADLHLVGTVVDLDGGGAILRVRDAPNGDGMQIYRVGSAISAMWTAGDAFRAANATGGGYQPMQASAFNVNSDVEQKDNVTDAPPGALDQVCSLRPVIFERPSEGTGGQHLGLIAQEVAAALPAAHVPAHPDEGEGHEGIDLMALVTTLAQATSELKAQVDALTARLDATGGTA